MAELVYRHCAPRVNEFLTSAEEPTPQCRPYNCWKVQQQVEKGGGREGSKQGPRCNPCAGSYQHDHDQAWLQSDLSSRCPFPYMEYDVPSEQCVVG